MPSAHWLGASLDLVVGTQEPERSDQTELLAVATRLDVEVGATRRAARQRRR